jgi:phenylalanyl-tRNA synthetase alpha chain
MIAAVVHAALPGAGVDTPASPHPYTTGGREIYARGVEIGECGLAHPAVLAGAGLGPGASGLAMGLGLDRLVMLVKGVPDIRLLRTTDPRVAGQMGDLAPYRPVSAMPAVRRDLSLALDGPPDAEDLGDLVREALGERARSVESVEIRSATGYDRLPDAARRRMGMSAGQWNVLVRIVLRDHDRSLTDADANELRDLVYRALHAGRAGEWTAPR